MDVSSDMRRDREEDIRMIQYFGVILRFEGKFGEFLWLCRKWWFDEKWIEYCECILIIVLMNDHSCKHS